MNGYGFINDELELKVLILYIAARLIEPIPFSTFLELIFCDDGIDYFDATTCLAALVRSEHLTLSEDGLYEITEKGRRNSQICESSLPPSIRRRCERNLRECNRKLRRERQVRASWKLQENGTYQVTMSLSDDAGSVMRLDVTVIQEDMAEALAERFRRYPEKIYTQLIGILLAEDSPGPNQDAISHQNQNISQNQIQNQARENVGADETDLVYGE